MTRDDIIRMAREACDPDTADAYKDNYWTLTMGELERFAELVAADEREACAKKCESCWFIDGTGTADEFAAAIRARGNP